MGVCSTGAEISPEGVPEENQGGTICAGSTFTGPRRSSSIHACDTAGSRRAAKPPVRERAPGRVSVSDAPMVAVARVLVPGRLGEGVAARHRGWGPSPALRRGSVEAGDGDSGSRAAQGSQRSSRVMTV